MLVERHVSPKDGTTCAMILERSVSNCDAVCDMCKSRIMIMMSVSDHLATEGIDELRGRGQGWRHGGVEAKVRSVAGGQRGKSLDDGRI